MYIIKNKQKKLQFYNKIKNKKGVIILLIIIIVILAIYLQPIR